MPWIEVGSTDIYYQEDGKPGAQPLVFLHGNTSCGEAWWQQFEHFRDRFHVFAYDSVNHGHSSNSPRDAEEPDRADELQGFLEAMNIRRPVLAGNSMGGNTIIRWAAAHPDAAAALAPSGSGIAATRPANGARPARAAPARPGRPLPADRRFSDRGLQGGPPAHARALPAHPLDRDAPGSDASPAPSRHAPHGPRCPHRRGRAVKSPMICIVGGLDGAVPSFEVPQHGRAGRRVRRNRGGARTTSTTRPRNPTTPPWMTSLPASSASPPRPRPRRASL